MSKTAERTHPELWETIKAEVTAGSKGGEPGEWSARKAQLAVQEYKKRGGGYRGGKAKDNALRQWTAEEWGTKSGQDSRETGERYLPKRARAALSEEEYRKTSDKKRADRREGRQHSPQPAPIAAKTARFRGPGKAVKRPRTRADLLREAKQLEIEGRSRMSKEELAEAVRYAKH
jgi:hypothetical protein